MKILYFRGSITCQTCEFCCANFFSMISWGVSRCVRDSLWPYSANVFVGVSFHLVGSIGMPTVNAFCISLFKLEFSLNCRNISSSSCPFCLVHIAKHHQPISTRAHGGPTGLGRFLATDITNTGASRGFLRRIEVRACLLSCLCVRVCVWLPHFVFCFLEKNRFRVLPSTSMTLCYTTCI